MKVAFSSRRNTLSPLDYKYACVNCGHWVKKEETECHNCAYVFSEAEKIKMERKYDENLKANWHHMIYFVLFMALVFGGIYVLKT